MLQECPRGNVKSRKAPPRCSSLRLTRRPKVSGEDRTQRDREPPGEAGARLRSHSGLCPVPGARSSAGGRERGGEAASRVGSRGAQAAEPRGSDKGQPVLPGLGPHFLEGVSQTPLGQCSRAGLALSSFAGPDNSSQLSPPRSTAQLDR